MNLNDEKQVTQPSVQEQIPVKEANAQEQIPVKKPNPLEGFRGLLFGVCMLVFLMGASTVAIHLYLKNYMSNSKNVYEVTIKNAVKSIQNMMEKYEGHSKMLGTLELNLESNIDPLQDLSDYSYILEFGVDYDEKIIQEGIKQKQSSDLLGATAYFKNNQLYLDLSTYDSIILLEEMEESDIELIFEVLESVNLKDFSYLMPQMGTWFSDGIQADKIEKSKTNLILGGKNVKVTEHRYLLNDEALTEIIKSIRDGILNDEKAIKLFADSIYVSESEFKKMLEESNPEINMFGNDTDGIVMKIYTSGSVNDVVGFQITNTTAPGEIHYYVDGNNFEFVLTGFTMEDAYEENTLKVVGTEQGKATNVSVNLNNQELATFVVRESSSEKTDFDYQLNLETPLKGTVTINTKEEKDKITTTGSISVEAEEGYIKLNINGNIDWNAKIADFDTKKVKELSEEELEKVLEEFLEKLVDSPLFPVVEESPILE